MILPEFLFIDPFEMGGAGFILKTVEPFEMGRVVKYKPDEYYAFNKGIFSQCAGYSVIIQQMEGLRQTETSQSTLEDMANWYKTIKLDIKPGYSKRFKL